MLNQINLALSRNGRLKLAHSNGNIIAACNATYWTIIKMEPLPLTYEKEIPKINDARSWRLPIPFLTMCSANTKSVQGPKYPILQMGTRLVLQRPQK